MAFAGVITTFTRDQNKSTGTVSATTTIAVLLTFMLGAYALLGDVRIAAAAAVVTTGILVVREELHGWVAKLSLAELESGLILLAMTFIALPIVPDRSVGPFGGVNPRAVWRTDAADHHPSHERRPVAGRTGRSVLWATSRNSRNATSILTSFRSRQIDPARP
jgi:hypothetical protein